MEKINQQAEVAKAEAARILNARREDQRKARTRELIELGGIVSMVDFPVDRGTLTGTLLWALDHFRTDDDLAHTLKKRGDTFIAERETEKNAKVQGSARSMQEKLQNKAADALAD